MVSSIKGDELKTIDEIYKELEDNIKIVSTPDYSKLVNFSENLSIPRHRWFNIKEGFSANIIKKLIKRFDGTKHDLVFDPFAGSGTTILAAKELGIPSFGFEINPFLAFLSRTKLYNKKSNLSSHVHNIENLKMSDNVRIPKLSIAQKLFNDQLNYLLSVKQYIDNLKDSQEKDLLKIAFLCSLENSSTAKKDGNGLKYPKNKKIIPFKEAIITKIKEIENDINTCPLNDANSKIFNLDVRNLNQLLDNKDFKNYIENVSLCIFSPPYMNCFDYTEIYKIELWFGDFIKDYGDLKKLRNASLTSHLNKIIEENYYLENKDINSLVGKIAEQLLWNNKIPLMIKAYFKDMYVTLQGIYKLLKKDGRCIIVVGNSAYGNIAIPTDMILGKLGLEIGYSKCRIEIARHLGTSSQQYKKINNKSILRESLIILEK